MPRVIYPTTYPSNTTNANERKPEKNSTNEFLFEFPLFLVNVLNM